MTNIDKEDRAMNRFVGREAWQRLSSAEQNLVGAVALELSAAWVLQDRGAADGDPRLERIGEAADRLLIGMLQRLARAAAVQSAGDSSWGYYAADGAPLVPSLLGRFCRGCGYNEVAVADGAAARPWCARDLCAGCWARDAGVEL